MVERSEKRSGLARRVCRILGVGNLEIATQDVHDVETRYDVVIFRASLRIGPAAKTTKRLTHPGGLGLVGVARADGIPATGARGWGLSVFKGTEPERFEVEILGSVEGMGSTGTMILARLSGAGLEHTGVQQGMSGSPVYIDGELIGAVMSSWAFSKDPIAGIRPIAEMRALADDQRPADTRASAGPLTWNAEGFSTAALAAMGAGFGVEIQAAGTATTTNEDPRPLEPGDAMAVMLVDGDARLFAAGTVTERIDDRVLGFGHPFLSAGVVSLPLASAEVITVLASNQISFKIAAAGPVVGALELDRRAGVAGRLGARADVLPVHVRLSGDGPEPAQEFSFEVARLRGMTPQLAGWATQSALQDRRAAGPFSSARIEVVVSLEGQDPLHSRSLAAGRSLAGAAAAESGLLMGLLEGLVGEVPKVGSIEVTVEIREREPVSVFGRVKVYEPLLEAGEPLRGRVEVLGRDESSRWIEFEVPVPARLQPGAYRLRITDGVTNFGDEIARTGGRFNRMDLPRLREGLELRGSADRIVAVLYGPSESVVIGGAEFRALPASMHALLAGPGAGVSATDAAAEVLGRWEGGSGGIVTGEVFVDLRTRAPFNNGIEMPEPEPVQQQ